MDNLQKTIVIGIDSGCWEYINPLLEKDRLPNIKQLVQNGSHGILKSTIPPVSPAAWSSFITGKNPGKHSIFDWWYKDENKFRPTLSTDRKGTPFWKYLNLKGIRTGIMNIPLTYPPDKVDGFFICGFEYLDVSKNLPKTFPKDLHSYLDYKYGRSWSKLPSFSLLKEQKNNSIQRFLKLYESHEDTLTTIAIDLMQKYNVSMFAINYMILDHFNHLVKDYVLVEKALEIIQG